MDKKPHKHASLIHAWAEGAEIEYQRDDGEWIVVPNPTWRPRTTYRIKPTDVVRYARARFIAYSVSNPQQADLNKKETSTYWTIHPSGDDNIKATFDGETGQLKSVEMI